MDSPAQFPRTWAGWPISRLSISGTTSSRAPSLLELRNLAALELLGLGDNLLSGRIPKELGALANLMYLNLERNRLSGVIPPELGNASSLIGVLLSQNELAGTIPGTLDLPQNLETLWLDHNRFTGPVPFELGAIPTLVDDGGLDLRNNALATDTEPGLLGDLNAKQVGGDWISSQAASAPFDPSVPLSGLADRRTGKFVLWTLDVGAGAPPLTLSTSGGTGDVDLYVRFGAAPTTAQSDVSSVTAGNTESVTIAAPHQGTYYIGLYSHSPYKGVTLQTGGPAGCFPGGTSLCLANHRFKVEAAWRTSDGRTGAGQAVALTGDTGYFWFFDASNVEAVVKVLDACTFNQRFWVFAGGLTDVQVDLTVTDTASGAVRTWRNPQGTAFQPIQDTGAFATCGATANIASTAPEEKIATLIEKTSEDLAQIVPKAGTCVRRSHEPLPLRRPFPGGRRLEDLERRHRNRPGRALDRGHRLLLVLRRLERGDGPQGAERLHVQPEVLGLRRRPHQRRDHHPRDRHDDGDGKDLHEPAGNRPSCRFRTRRRLGRAREGRPDHESMPPRLTHIGMSARRGATSSKARWDAKGKSWRRHLGRSRADRTTAMRPRRS